MFFFENWQFWRFRMFLVPKTMSPYYVRSKVCIAIFHVQSKVNLSFSEHFHWQNIGIWNLAIRLFWAKIDAQVTDHYHIS